MFIYLLPLYFFCYKLTQETKIEFSIVLGICGLL